MHILIHSYTKIAISNIISLNYEPTIVAIVMIILYLFGFPLFVVLYLLSTRTKLKEVLLKKHIKRNF